MRSDIEIARAATLRPIEAVAARLGIPDEALHRYGRRGFVPVARRRDYYAPGVDAVVMRRPPGAERGRP